jgi:transcriptional regulator with XRE-family HTH domain
MPKHKHLLQDYLDRTGRSQASLARELHITPSYASMIISGRRRPSPELAAKIESVTGIPLRDLLLARRSKKKAR